MKKDDTPSSVVRDRREWAGLMKGKGAQAEGPAEQRPGRWMTQSLLHFAFTGASLEPKAGSGLRWGQETDGFKQTMGLEVMLITLDLSSWTAGLQVWGPGLVRALP